jgi:putative DNA primase/helicase
MTAAPIDLEAPVTALGQSEPAFVEIIRQAGLADLSPDTSLAELSPRLEALATGVAGADARTLALVREDAIKRIRASGATDAPAKLVDAHLPRVSGAPEDGKQGGAVSFATAAPWPEPVETAALLAELAGALARHVILPPGGATATALWLLHTYALDAAHITPRLAILSPLKRCGKSTLLKMLGALVHRPLSTANLTAAALFRIVEAQAPTLLVDEADTFLRENEELRGVLNAGHDRQSAQVVRCVGDEHEPRTFRVWAPVAIAAIGKIPDTLMDRSVVVAMKRKAPGESVKRFRRREQAALADLRRKCERWAIDCAPSLCDVQPRLPDELNDRAADNWEALLAIADLAGMGWGDRARKAAALLSGADADDEATQGETLLTDVRTVFEARAIDRLSTKTLLDDLAKLDGRPWAEASKGRPLTSHHLGRLLKRFDIRPGTIRLDNGSTPKGYKRADFEDAWARYVPRETATTATSTKRHANPGNMKTPQPPDVADRGSVETASHSEHVADVADPEGDYAAYEYDRAERAAIESEGMG